MQVDFGLYGIVVQCAIKAHNQNAINRGIGVFN